MIFKINTLGVTFISNTFFYTFFLIKSKNKSHTLLFILLTLPFLKNILECQKTLP